MANTYSRSSYVYDPYESVESLVSINSRHALPGGSTTDFTVKFDKIISPDTIKLAYFSIPNVIFNIQESFILEETGFLEVTGTMPGKFYTDLNIEAELGAYLTSISPSASTYTVVLDNDTAKLTITSTGPNWRFGGAAGVNILNDFYLGIGAVRLTGDQVQALANPQTLVASIYLIPAADGFYIQLSTNTNEGTSSTDCLSYTFHVPEASISRQELVFSMNTFVQTIKCRMNQQITKFRVTITDARGRLINTEGGLTVIELLVAPRTITHLQGELMGAFGQNLPGEHRYLQ